MVLVASNVLFYFISQLCKGTFDCIKAVKTIKFFNILILLDDPCSQLACGNNRCVCE